MHKEADFLKMGSIILYNALPLVNNISWLYKQTRQVFLLEMISNENIFTVIRFKSPQIIIFLFAIETKKMIFLTSFIGIVFEMSFLSYVSKTNEKIMFMFSWSRHLKQWIDRGSISGLLSVNPIYIY